MAPTNSSPPPKEGAKKPIDMERRSPSQIGGRKTDLSSIKSALLLEAATEMVGAVKSLRDELLKATDEYNRRRRSDRFKVVALAALLFFSVGGGWYQAHSNGKQINILKSLADPNGEAAKRGKVQTACAILDVINDSRRLHGAPTIQQPAELNCLPKPSP